MAAWPGRSWQREGSMFHGLLGWLGVVLLIGFLTDVGTHPVPAVIALLLAIVCFVAFLQGRQS